MEALAFVLLSASFFFLPPGSHELGIAGVGLILAFILAWNASWAPLMFVVCSEVLPAKVRRPWRTQTACCAHTHSLAAAQARGVGMGAALTAFWLTSFLTNQLLLSLVEWVGDAAAFMLLACTTLLALLFVFLRVPETKDKPLHEIAQLFRDLHGMTGLLAHAVWMRVPRLHACPPPPLRVTLPHGRTRRTFCGWRCYTRTLWHQTLARPPRDERCSTTWFRI